MMIRELLFFRLIGHLRCGLGSTGLLKEESDTVIENLTSPWHSGASLRTPDHRRTTRAWSRSGSCLCCQRGLRDGPLNLYWYCQLSLSSVWYAQKPLRGWTGCLNRALAFRMENYKHLLHYRVQTCVNIFTNDNAINHVQFKVIIKNHWEKVCTIKHCHVHLN